MFNVYDYDIPARCPEYQCHESKKTNSFKTFDKALEYVKKWIGPIYTSYLPPNWNGSKVYMQYHEIEIR